MIGLQRNVVRFDNCLSIFVPLRSVARHSNDDNTNVSLVCMLTQLKANVIDTNLAQWCRKMHKWNIDILRQIILASKRNLPLFFSGPNDFEQIHYIPDVLELVDRHVVGKVSPRQGVCDNL